MECGFGWKSIDNCFTRNLDRKSTRLNSSHLVISYAVFCLKKKNIDNETLVTRNLCTHSALPQFMSLPTPPALRKLAPPGKLNYSKPSSNTPPPAHLHHAPRR